MQTRRQRELEAAREGARRYGSIENARPFDAKKLAEPRPCPECEKEVVLVDTTTGLCKNCFDADQEK